MTASKQKSPVFTRGFFHSANESKKLAFIIHPFVGRGYDPAAHLSVLSVRLLLDKDDILRKNQPFPYRNCVGGVITPPYENTI